MAETVTTPATLTLPFPLSACPVYWQNFIDQWEPASAKADIVAVLDAEYNAHPIDTYDGHYSEMRIEFRDEKDLTAFILRWS